ncbi:MAG: membrane-bound lytic murein transglycosylase MltF [Sinobacteraceae bacterium]|nr:membrane-bound lytic murein transglycosylase MltF [Nevskiaceae bacterium]
MVNPLPILWPYLRNALRRMPWRRIIIGTVAVVAVGGISTCSPPPPLLERIQAHGVLRVATTNSPATCYRGEYEPLGYQCKLLRKFATHLGAKLQVDYVPNRQAALAALLEGRVQLAAGVMADSVVNQPLDISPPVQRVSQQLVYSSAPRPRSLDTLSGTLAVVADGAAEAALESTSVLHDGLTWQSIPSVSDEDLLFRVATDTLAYTVAGSDLIKLNQRFYPNLISSLKLTRPQPVVWAVRSGADDSLAQAMDAFFAKLGKKGLQQLHADYFEDRSSLTYLDIVRLTQDYSSILPEYRQTFVKAGTKNDVDWRLMAAIGYQESHWISTAVSPTGVHGLMMLTLPTAEQVNVADRTQPKAAIRGGTRYFSWVMSRIPFSVPRPDRMWMAAAAWNMGLGHVLDALELVRQRGGDPNSWADVRDVLSLLTQKKWFSQTRYGYGQGYQAMAFVDNVQSYYHILVWLTDGESRLVAPPLAVALEMPLQASSFSAGGSGEDNPAVAIDNTPSIRTANLAKPSLRAKVPEPVSASSPGKATKPHLAPTGNVPSPASTIPLSPGNATKLHAWWETDLIHPSDPFELIYAGDAAFTKAIVLLFSAPVDVASATGIQVVNSAGHTVQGRWRAGSDNPTMLVFETDPGLYTVTVSASVKSEKGHVLSKTRSGPVEVK